MELRVEAGPKVMLTNSLSGKARNVPDNEFFIVAFNYQLIRMRKAALKTGKNGIFQFCGLLWNQTQPEEIRAAQLQQGKKLYFCPPQAVRFVWAFCWASQWVKLQTEHALYLW